MTKFINSTALFTDKLLGSDFDAVLMEFLLMVCENLKTGRTMDSIAELDWITPWKNEWGGRIMWFFEIYLLSNKDATKDAIEVSMLLEMCHGWWPQET